MFAGLAHAGCIGMGTREAAAKSDVIFRGTIVDVHAAQRDALTDLLHPPEHIVVFRVGRVWKGKMGAQFELSAPEPAPTPGGIISAERGWYPNLPIGTELLFFARRDHSGKFVTSPCYGSELIQAQSQVLQELGSGRSAIKH